MGILNEIKSDEEKKLQKKKQNTIIFDNEPESASINHHDIQVAKNGGLVCYGNSGLAILQGLIGSETLFLDFETGSYNAKLDSLNPWRNCWPIGVAICSGMLSDETNYGPAYYIEINKENEKEVYHLLSRIFNDVRLKYWINHNIKYDAHVLYNSCGVEVPYSCKLIDTLTLAKLIDSDRFRYGLDQLSKDWLDQDNCDIYQEYEAAFKPYLYKNKDYSVIPTDILGPYACQDVITNRRLYDYICKNLPEECYYIRDIEIELTRILIQIERNGLRVNPEHLQYTEIINLKKLIEIEQELEKITGRSFRPHTNADCFDILCNFYGLPILKWTNNQELDKEYVESYEESESVLSKDEQKEDEKCNASFDKDAIIAYLSHPLVLADEKIKRVVELISEYRKVNTFNNLFVKKYQELIIGDTLHPFYNQTVRTGRMSCKQPNSQQLSKQAKSLIIPYHNQETDRDDEVFVSYDFSQIEYRTIAHYIESELLTTEYTNNPDVDFHQKVADIVRETTNLEGMTRGPGKTLNFALSFGMGKKKTIRRLKANLELMGSLVKELEGVEDFAVYFDREAEKRAILVYETYHNLLPEIKSTSKTAESSCKYKGYVRTLYNRRRHLPFDKSYRAFNTANQGSAADIMKDAMVRVSKDLLEPCRSPIYNEQIIRIVADVHDEMLFSMPECLANDTRITHTIAHYMENPVFPSEKKLSVPIRVAMGIGKNWKEASTSATVQKYDSAVNKEEFCNIVNGLYAS